MIDQRVVDDVTVVTMQAGENRFNLPFVTALAGALEAAATRAKPLVLTGEGKFFCNGLDLEWMQREGTGQTRELMDTLHGIFARLVSFPGATVAAINGHAFGGGAIMTGTTDFRVMRADRGFFCFPEVDLGMAMSDQFDAVIQARFPAPALWRALLSGHRYTGPEAKEAGLVEEVASEDDLVDTAIDLVRDLAAKDGEAVARLKAKHYQRVLEILGTGGG
jgi:Delta3-Delta2-enoyl-CoA isomerase